MSITNCTELYQRSSEFQSAIAKWVADRRCPIQLGDYLQELGLDSAADCARWAASEPDRRVMSNPATMHGELGGICGPFPACNVTPNPQWCWCSCITDNKPGTRAFDVPERVESDMLHHKTPTLAILWLLDNWPGNLICNGREN